MKLIEHVYAVKNILSRGASSDDFRLRNSLIAHFLQVARARLIEQKIDKYHFISGQSYQDWCVNLESLSFHSCCNMPELPDCKLLRSVEEVPRFLNSRWGNHLKVMDLSGYIIPEINLTQFRLSKYGIVKIGTGWFLHNNYIYVVNNTNLKTVILNALYNDPQAIYDKACHDLGGDCPSFMDVDFPIDSDLIDPMYRLTLELLLQAYKINEDTENNAKDPDTTGQ